MDSKKKYFDNVLNFILFNDEKTEENLEMLLILRNAIAHGNGRKDAVNEHSWRKIQVWEKQGKGITSSSDRLEFSSLFVNETLAIVRDSLRDLLQRVRKFT